MTLFKRRNRLQLWKIVSVLTFKLIQEVFYKLICYKMLLKLLHIQIPPDQQCRTHLIKVQLWRVAAGVTFEGTMRVLCLYCGMQKTVCGCEGRLLVIGEMFTGTFVFCKLSPSLSLISLMLKLFPFIGLESLLVFLIFKKWMSVSDRGNLVLYNPGHSVLFVADIWKCKRQWV